MKNILAIKLYSSFVLPELSVPTGLPWEDGGNQGILTAMADIYSQLAVLIIPISVLSVMICGFTLMVGDRHTVDTARHWLFNILIGLILFISFGAALHVNVANIFKI